MAPPLALIAWLVMGLVAGALGRFFLPGEPRLGWIASLSAGLAGALLGGLLATALGFGGLAGFDVRGFVTATLGAILALLVVRLLRLPKA